MLDIEMLRIEKLIEEREAYENAFFSMEDNNEEFYFTISQFDDCQEFIVEPFDYEEELIEPIEDFFEKLREEKLINERIFYEIDYFKSLDYEIVEIDVDSLNEPYEEPEYNLGTEFEMYFDEHFNPSPIDDFDFHPIEEPSFKKPRCCWGDMDYMPNDDFSDDTDCYFYPDGDLLGIYPL